MQDGQDRAAPHGADARTAHAAIHESVERLTMEVRRTQQLCADIDDGLARHYREGVSRSEKTKHVGDELEHSLNEVDDILALVVSRATDLEHLAGVGAIITGATKARDILWNCHTALVAMRKQSAAPAS